jgi:hypothetical protein
VLKYVKFSHIYVKTLIFIILNIIRFILKYIFIIYLFDVIGIKIFTYIFNQTLNTLIKNVLFIVAFVLGRECDGRKYYHP